MKRKYIYALSIAALLLPMVSNADTLNYLTVKNNGDKTSVEITQLGSILFTEDEMVINLTDGTRNISLDTFEKMKFTENQPGDVNGDGNISVGDITSIAEMILSGETDNGDAVAADMDDNEDITVGDITKVADIILKQEQ